MHRGGLKEITRGKNSPFFFLTNITNGYSFAFFWKPPIERH
jgi:hypothetical protein